MPARHIPPFPLTHTHLHTRTHSVANIVMPPRRWRPISVNKNKDTAAAGILRRIYARARAGEERERKRRAVAAASMRRHLETRLLPGIHLIIFLVYSYSERRRRRPRRHLRIPRDACAVARDRPRRTGAEKGKRREEQRLRALPLYILYIPMLAQYTQCRWNAQRLRFPLQLFAIYVYTYTQSQVSERGRGFQRRERHPAG